MFSVEQGAEQAKVHIESVFDLNKNVNKKYRKLSKREGLLFLSWFAPRATQAYLRYYRNSLMA
jgi:hypothetical protein